MHMATCRKERLGTEQVSEQTTTTAPTSGGTEHHQHNKRATTKPKRTPQKQGALFTEPINLKKKKTGPVETHSSLLQSALSASPRPPPWAEDSPSSPKMSPTSVAPEAGASAAVCHSWIRAAELQCPDGGGGRSLSSIQKGRIACKIITLTICLEGTGLVLARWGFASGPNRRQAGRHYYIPVRTKYGENTARLTFFYLVCNDARLRTTTWFVAVVWELQDNSQWADG